MILRRLAEAFRRQDWAVIVIELVIVVLGVFIGIEVSNWNEERRDRALEHQYLQRLHGDFERSIAQADTNIELLERQFELEGLMVDSLLACDLAAADRDDFAAGIYLIGRLEPPPLQRDTLDELRSTGRAAIITNVALRRQINEAVRVQQSNARVLDFIIARISPHVAYIDARAVLLQPEGGFSYYESGVTAEQVRYDFTALCADPQYVAAVSAIREITRVVTSHNRQRRADYARLVTALAEELGEGTAATRQQ